LQASNSKTVVPSPTTISRKSLLYTWYFVHVEIIE
jgi:hypothetical protein